MRAGNGFGAILRLALDGPVRYTAHGGDEARIGLQLLCRDRAQIHGAYADFLRGMPSYRSHLKGLYLTGASTHPGGGIMGASGRNVARVLLKDLSRRRV